jgi:chromosome segregation ATPase
VSKSTTGSAPRTAAALATRRRTTDAALARVRDALAHMRKHRMAISTAAVARHAGVSRTFLYDNPTARATVTAAIADTGQRQHDTRLAGTADQEMGWRERALNAENALKAAHGEIALQRTRIGELLGRLRDLETATADEDLNRIATENTTLKQRVRELTAQTRTLEERLAGARSTLRFQDRRIADLQAQLADPAAVGTATAAPRDPGRCNAAVPHAQG